MFKPQCPSGSVIPRIVNTTFQAAAVSGSPSKTIATFKPHCPTALMGTVGQTFIPKCPSGTPVPGVSVFQPACPTGDL
jgi:hypothetical protein